MKKSTRKNQNTPVLENLVTDEAKRQAESLGVPLETFIGGIAMKGETMPVTIRIRMDDIRRINAVVNGGRIHEWAERVILDVLECEEGEEQEKIENRIMLDLPADTAARLRTAAKFEEMSVEEYLLDGLGRDLDLSESLIEAANSAKR